MNLMRYTGMAIIDTAISGRKRTPGERGNALEGTYLSGQRRKTGEPFGLDIPKWLADELLSLPGKHFFWDGKEEPRLVVGHYEKALHSIFFVAKVRMTPHKFRHYFITQQLAAGWSAGEVADMVGTSESEIRKTYKHWVTEGRERVREASRRG